MSAQNATSIKARGLPPSQLIPASADRHRKVTQGARLTRAKGKEAEEKWRRVTANIRENDRA